MYEGVKQKILESPIKDEIYRGAHMTKIEIEKIHDCLKNKKKQISAGILFCRAFLSFSCIKSKAIKFALKDKYYDKNTMKRVLFILKSNPKINETFTVKIILVILMLTFQNILFIQTKKKLYFFLYLVLKL